MLRAILLICLAIGVILELTPDAMAKRRKEDLPKIDPPALVVCNAQFCDRDKDHLEAFLVGFYKWYVRSRNEIFMPSWDKLPKDVFQKNRILHDTEQEEIISKFVTPQLFIWRKNQGKNFDSGVYDIKYCGTDVDTFTCTQDDRDEWMTMTMSTVEIINKNTAQAIVDLVAPTLELDKGKYPNISDGMNDHLKIRVGLKVYKNSWRIDTIHSLN